MIALPLALAASLMANAPSSLAALRWHSRVLLVSAPDARDPRLLEQRRMMSRWKAGAADRELIVVEIVGETVHGAADAASALRRRYRMRATGFVIALIGKDGGIKLHRTQPIAPATLEATIDAMPMRRNESRQILHD